MEVIDQYIREVTGEPCQQPCDTDAAPQPDPVPEPPQTPTYVPAVPVMDELAQERAKSDDWKGVGEYGNIDTKMDNQTDIAVALRFYRKHYRRVRYVESLDDPWLVWDGRRWVKGESKVYEMFVLQLQDMLEEANAIKDDDFKKKTRGWIGKLLTDSKIRSLMKALSSIEDIPMEADEFDSNRYLINLKNGEYDLQAMILRPHYAYTYNTKMIDIDYCEGSRAPHWEQFLREVIPDEGTRHFLQRSIGYSLTGDTSEPALFMLYGKGANGKSVFLNVIRALLSNYAAAISPSVFLEDVSNSTKEFQVANLKGARFVSCEEMPEDKYFDEALIKAMTAGAPRTCCYKFKPHFTYHPTDHIFIATNYRPLVKGADHAIWRRIKLIPFMVTIEEEQQDRHLTEHLIDELPGILNWALEGWRGYIQRGGLDTPSAILAAIDEYKHESDPLSGWYEDRCIFQMDGEKPPEADVHELYNDYEAWADWNHIPKKGLIGLRAFGRRVGARRGISKRKSNSKYIYVGIGLKPDYKNRNLGINN